MEGWPVDIAVLAYEQQNAYSPISMPHLYFALQWACLISILLKTMTMQKAANIVLRKCALKKERKKKKEWKYGKRKKWEYPTGEGNSEKKYEDWEENKKNINGVMSEEDPGRSLEEQQVEWEGAEMQSAPWREGTWSKEARREGVQKARVWWKGAHQSCD